MNKRFNKGVSIILILFILSSSIPSFAATFPDVKSTHWAYTHIEKMVKLKMIKGHDDGTFKPNDTVSYLENLQLISSLISLSTEELNAGKMAYGSLLTELKIASWAQEAVIKSLYKGVISEKELKEAQSKGLTTTGTRLRPDRLTISIYLAKAMGLEELANSKPVIVLPYKESLTIEGKYHKYLAVLIDAKVLNPEGTGGGYFEPKSSVKRDAMAKMLSTAYDYLQKNPVKPVEPEKPKEEVIIKGTVVSVYSDAIKTYVTVKDRYNSEKAYVIDSKTKITIDNKTGVVANIIKGQDIELITIKGDLTAIAVSVKSLEEKIEGIVKNSSYATNKITVEYTKDKLTKAIELPIDKNATIYLNEKKSDLYSIKNGDTVILTTNNNIVIEIEATSKVRNVTGTIKDVTIGNRTKDVDYITIIDSKDKSYKYEIDPDVYIYRKNKSAKLEDLKQGDKVTLELEYELVLEIDADVVEKEIDGHITGISTRVGQGTIITIRNKDTGKDEEYTLSRDAYIRIDNVVASSYDLKVNYYSEILVEGNEIVEIYAESRSSNSTIIGKVTYIDTKRKQLEITVDSYNADGYNYGDLVTIYTKSDVIIKDIYSNNFDLYDLRKGDIVNVIGAFDGATFIADIIMILK